LAAALLTLVGAAAARGGGGVEYLSASTDQGPAGEVALFMPLTWRGSRDSIPRPVPNTPPPAATEIPTSTPTLETTPTSTVTPTVTAPTATEIPSSPTPSPTPALLCTELVQNGDFEAGAASWSLTVAGNRQPSSQAIQPRAQVPVAPHGGDWLAWLGGFNSGLAQLRSVGLRSYEPSQVVSGTLRFWTAIVTQETSNRRANDRIRVRIEGERRELLIEAATRSEEDFPAPSVWQLVSLDFLPYLSTDVVKNMTLDMEADELNASWFYFDDVSITSCVPTGRAPSG
jgi:hypothetical protein